MKRWSKNRFKTTCAMLIFLAMTVVLYGFYSIGLRYFITTQTLESVEYLQVADNAIEEIHTESKTTYAYLQDRDNKENTLLLKAQQKKTDKSIAELQKYITYHYKQMIPSTKSFFEKFAQSQKTRLSLLEKNSTISVEPNFELLLSVFLNQPIYDYPALWSYAQLAQHTTISRSLRVNALEGAIGLMELSSDRQRSELIILGFITLLLLVFSFFMVRFFESMKHELKSIKELLEELVDEKDATNDNLAKAVAKGDTKVVYQFLKKLIFEVKESQAMAQKSNKIKSLFLANMSHEIRTPLNGIMGFTELLKTTELTTEQLEFVQIIQKSSENLLNIIGDVLDLSKIESERVKMEVSEFDLFVEIESVVEEYTLKASEKEIDLGLYIDPKLISYRLTGDSTKIKQVLINLIHNAIKFTSQNGSINIHIEKTEKKDTQTTLLFKVKDSSNEISINNQEKIFEAFSQEDTSNIIRKYSGTGLGLAICAKLLELMGSKLHLSRDKNKGATFYFSIDFDSVLSDKTITKYNELSVAYYQPAERISSLCLRDTIRYLNILCKQADVIMEIDTQLLPDILFVDFEDITTQTLQTLLLIKCDVVVVIKPHHKNKINELDFATFKTIYTPITFTKLQNILDLTKQKVNTTTKVVELKPFSVLVAEDNLINQKLIKRVLENMGAIVTLAENGEVALNYRKENRYDIIFLDIQMPVMGGIEATHAILKFEKEQNQYHIPIVALTANALEGDKERYILEGMDGYASKPIQIDSISLLLQEFLPYKIKNQETK